MAPSAYHSEQAAGNGGDPAVDVRLLDRTVEGLMPRAAQTDDVVPDRSPPDVTASVVAITDQARTELREGSDALRDAVAREASALRETVVRATVVIVFSLALVGATIALQLDRVRDAIFMHQQR